METIGISVMISIGLLQFILTGIKHVSTLIPCKLLCLQKNNNLIIVFRVKSLHINGLTISFLMFSILDAKVCDI